MKIKLNIKSIIFMTIIAIATLLFINISFAANTGKVVVETAKLREQANADSKVLELASLGEEVEILNEEEDWYKVKYKNITCSDTTLSSNSAPPDMLRVPRFPDHLRATFSAQASC